MFRPSCSVKLIALEVQYFRRQRALYTVEAMGESLAEEVINTLAQVQREIERTFRDLWTKIASERPIQLGTWEPPADVIDRDDEVVIYVDVPGFSKDDIRVRVTEDSVEVRAERREEGEVEGRYVIKQRVRESLYKKIELPVKVRPEQARARLENGVLEIRIPKSEVAREVQVVVE